jgi:hypothetical protein
LALASDGTEQTYRLTEHAAEDAGKETEDAAKKSVHAVVYYTEEAGHKVAHFFRASCGRGPFHDFYAGLLAKGMKPEMARLTLARKIAAITLTLWKKEERFDAEQLKTQAA